MATASITDQMKLLLKLQELDAELYSRRRELSLKPQQAARLKEEFEGLKGDVRKAQEELKAAEVKRNQLEMELGQKEGSLKKFQGQLFTVKTNKEYAALQKEIEGFKADQSVLEEEILKLMEEADRKKGRLTAEQEVLKGQEKALEEKLNRLEQEKKTLEDSVQRLEADRGSWAAQVDRKILGRYERILENKEGLALVPVRGGACGGCHMVLPPQMLNEIHLGERLITCESCARILILESPPS
ncbi:MAG: hypothetical protein HYS41_00505 [Candidatus Omnitrophica bacterium]|nr:hypothetical protein [Candidatus Omnitrophota bacterium]